MMHRMLGAPTILLALALAMMLSAQENSGVIAHFNKSLSYESQGKLTEALSEMEAAAALPEAKDDYLVTVRLGWVNYLNHNYDASKQYYRDAFRTSKQKSVEALLGLTLPLAATQDWTEVEATYLKALAVDPSNYTANVKLGEIYLSRGDYADAEKYTGRALDLFPGEYEANLYFGWSAYWSGSKGRARIAFEHALMLSPGDTSATNGLGQSK
jgi:tetratricopeptide (TPR) repeat protein